MCLFRARYQMFDFIDEFIDFLELHQTQQPGSTRPAP
jgi:hypothetical protein